MSIICKQSPCFTRGHLVLTNKGYIDISQIKIGDMVLTHTGEYRKVTKTESYIAETTAVKISGFPEIITTNNQPFYTVTRSRLWNNNIRRAERVFTDPCWTKVEDFTTDHFCGQIIPHNQEHETNLSLQDCWLLGRYIADGHVRKNKRSGRKNSYQYQFIISVGDSKLEDFKSKITERHYVCFQHSQSTHRCVFCSMELVNFIIDNDFGRSANTKRIPEFIYSLPYEYKKEFLMGYLSGDGFYDNNKDNWKASTVSKELAFDIQRLATQIFVTNVTVSCVGKRKDGHRINGRLIRSNFDTYTITIPTEIKSQSKAYINDNIVWTQVKKVENTGNKKVVYNIEVETDNSYTVNNCIVHNCTQWSISKAEWSTVCASRAECKGNVWLGDYMIRSVTMSELEKLQTLPVGYTSCLQNKELRGRGIGNGWTCDLIAHIFKGLKQEEILCE